MSDAPNPYREVEDIETRLDACARRVQDLESHVRAEIEQQQEEMRRLRSQLRRTLRAVAALYLAPPTSEGQEEPVVEFHEPEQTVEPIEQPVIEAAVLVPEADKPTAEEPTVDPGEVVAEDDARLDPSLWNYPHDAGAPSDLTLPNTAFTPPPRHTPAGTPDPLAEAKLAEDPEPAPAPKPLSELDLLLDWSDFESDEADAAEDGIPAAPPRDALPAPSIPLPFSLHSVLPRCDPQDSTLKPTPSDDQAADETRGDEHDLTLISGIDEEVQVTLRRLGVTPLDEIAGWNRTDAGRIADHLERVTESEIFDRWVLEAQATLFDLFQQRLSVNRFHNLDELQDQALPSKARRT